MSLRFTVLACSGIFALNTLFASGVNAAAVKKISSKQLSATEHIKTTKIELLRPWDMKKLKATQMLQYLRALQTLVASLENSTNSKKTDHAALFNFFVERSFADSNAGDDCVIGGYISTWAKNAAGHLSCSAPLPEQLIDAPAPKTFFCGETGSGDRKAFCNSAVFLYAGDSNDRFCQPLQNFSANCQKAFEARYSRGQGEQGDPHFPERLVHDFDQFAKATSPKELDTYLDDYDTFLNNLIKDNAFDAQTAEIIRKQVGIIVSTRDLVRGFPEGTPANPVTAPQATTQPPSPTIPNLTTASAAGSSGGDASVSPSQPPTDQKQIIPASYTGPGDQDPRNDPDPSAAKKDPSDADSKADESKLLGKELSCVRDGLTRLGYQPSERFLALIGAGVQAGNGAYDTNQEVSRKMFRSRVISMVQAYGFCDESSYPSNKLKNNDFNLTRRWLTADSGRAQPKLGMQYLIQMNDPKTQGATTRAFYDIFGLRNETKSASTSTDKNKKSTENISDSVEEAFHSVFVQSEKEWNQESLPERQSHIHDWTTAKAGSDFEKCHKNANDRRLKDDSFRLQTLRLPPAGKDGKRPPISESRKAEIAKVTQANLRVCEAMTSACDIDAEKLCDGGAGAAGKATPGAGVSAAPTSAAAGKSATSPSATKSATTPKSVTK